MQRPQRVLVLRTGPPPFFQNTTQAPHRSAACSVQRGHANTLENYASILLLTAIAGLRVSCTRKWSSSHLAAACWGGTCAGRLRTCEGVGAVGCRLSNRSFPVWWQQAHQQLPLVCTP